jgi:hypothetical protein
MCVCLYECVYVCVCVNVCVCVYVYVGKVATEIAKRTLSQTNIHSFHTHLTGNHVSIHTHKRIHTSAITKILKHITVYAVK